MTPFPYLMRAASHAAPMEPKKAANMKIGAGASGNRTAARTTAAQAPRVCQITSGHYHEESRFGRHSG